MKILVVTDQLPGHVLGFQKSGHAQYLGSILDHFSSRNDDVALIVFRPSVDFLAIKKAGLGYKLLGPSFAHVGDTIVLRSPAAIWRLFAWSVFGWLPQRWKSAVDAVRRRIRRAGGAVHHLGSFVSDEEIGYVNDAVRDEKPDLMIYDGIFNSCGLVADTERWLIAHEVKHQRVSSFEDQGIDVAASAVSSEVEGAILKQADTVIAIQWDDATELQRLAPGARVIVVPATMPIPPIKVGTRIIPGRCVFVGSGSFHNFDGISWFLERCWPQIRAAVPAASLEVFGSVCFRVASVPPGVSLMGIVDDLAPAYSSAAVTIVPLRIGSGLKVKVIEAFAHAQAIVTTPVGAQGLMGLSPRPFEIAESEADFAAATISLLKDTARQHELREAAVRCAEAFTPEAAFATLDAAMPAASRVYA